MNAAQHYAAAQALLNTVQTTDGGHRGTPEWVTETLAIAQVHATLAHAALTADVVAAAARFPAGHSFVREWVAVFNEDATGKQT